MKEVHLMDDRLIEFITKSTDYLEEKNLNGDSRKKNK